jgi:RNA-binding protein
MDRLKGFQKRFLRGAAHSLKPVVFVGQKGFSATLIDAMNEALNRHELVKVKFIEFKQKEKKLALVQQIETAASCEMVAVVGHMATFFRRHSDPRKRIIKLPQRSGG